MGCLAYVGVAGQGVEIFDWLLALSGLAALFTWGSICLAHIRFRNAWKYHGRNLDEFRSKQSVEYVVLTWDLNNSACADCSILCGYFRQEMTEMNDAAGFFKAYLAFFVVAFFWAVGYVWKRAGWLKLSQIDVDSGRREIDWEAHRAEAEKRRNAGPFKKVIYFMF